MGGAPPDPRIVRELERRLESGEVPSWLHARLMGAVRREERRRLHGRRWQLPRRALAVAAAVVLLVLAVGSSPMLRDRLAALAGRAEQGGAAGSGNRPSQAVTPEALLPRSGRYATLAGGTVEWQVRRQGSRLRLTEVLPAVSASAKPATRTYDLALQGNCLEEQGGSAAGAAGDAVAAALYGGDPVVGAWYCLPDRPGAGGGTAGAGEGSGLAESWVQDPAFGRVLRVRLTGTSGGQAYEVERLFAPGRGLVRQLWLDDQGRLLDEWVLLTGPAARRPLLAQLPFVPFGAAAEQLPYRLVTPADLPFSFYVPADSALVPGGFQVEPIQVGAARGIRYGLLDRRTMVTEVVFLPPGASLQETIANMLQAMVDFRKPPYDLVFQESPTDASAPWVLRSYTGSNRNDPTMNGLASVSRYRDRYFYMIRVGWYEQASVADLQSWQWEDGKGFEEGITAGAAAGGSGSAP